MKLARLAALAWGIALGTHAYSAAAALDPDTAEASVQAVMREQSYGFCSSPPHPLSPGAETLCPLAGEVPFCDALVKECASAHEVEKPGPFWDKVLHFLERVARFVFAISPYVAWTVVVGLFLLVVYLIVRAVRAAKDDVVLLDPHGDVDVKLLPDAPVTAAAAPAEVLLRRAAELEARGDRRGALSTYLAAALRALDDRGALQLTRDRTNGEYLRTCREAESRPPLREIVRDVDLVQFGGDDATLEAVARARDRAVTIVWPPALEPRARPGVPPGVTSILGVLALVVLSSACGGRFGAHNDPGGHDLLGDLLIRQGAQVRPLAGSLATLPMKGRGAPALILDAHRVSLEEDTRAHVVAWVKQGGTLVIAGDPSDWPSDFWAKHTESTGTVVRVETRSGATAEDEDDQVDDDEGPGTRVDQLKLPHTAAMTWPSEDRAPRAIARLEGGELFGALRDFGDGKILGLASADLLTNLGLVVPGNAAAVVALLSTLGTSEFIIVRREQGAAPPSNPFSGLMRIGLGLALAHALFFIPLLFIAYGMRQVAPKPEPAPRRRAFAEHVLAVGALYARRRAAGHALAVFARHVDDRVRAKMPRASDPALFLAQRSGEDLAGTSHLYARAMASKTGGPLRGDELFVLERLSAVYAKAMQESQEPPARI